MYNRSCRLQRDYNVNPNALTPPLLQREVVIAGGQLQTPPQNGVHSEFRVYSWARAITGCIVGRGKGFLRGGILDRGMYPIEQILKNGFPLFFVGFASGPDTMAYKRAMTPAQRPPSTEESTVHILLAQTEAVDYLQTRELAPR